MKLRPFLLGILVGQLVMLPYVVHLIRTPRIVAETVPDRYYNFNETRHKTINDIPVGHVLSINIASMDKVNEEYQKLDPGGVRVAGFYSYGTNTIWCIHDPLVLAHEIKHATEGDYHR